MSHMTLFAICPVCGKEVRINLEHRLDFHGCAGSKQHVTEVSRTEVFGRVSFFVIAVLDQEHDFSLTTEVRRTQKEVFDYLAEEFPNAYRAFTETYAALAEYNAVLLHKVIEEMNPGVIIWVEEHTL